jgi:hypothetical protein
MRKSVLATLAIVWLVDWSTAQAGTSAPEGRPVVLRPGRPPADLTAPTIEFAEFFVMGDRAPRPSAKLLSLHRQRVTVLGHMARLQRPVRGGFFLTGQPVACDESGGGRGDLPAAAVLVLPGIPLDREVTFVAGALEVTGVLDVGNADYQGEGVNVRLTVDDLRQIRFAKIPHAKIPPTKIPHTKIPPTRTRHASHAPPAATGHGSTAIKGTAVRRDAIEDRSAK